MILYQWLCTLIKTFKAEFRQRYDIEFRFGIKNLTSCFLPQNFPKKAFFVKFHFECVFLDLANKKSSKQFNFAKLEGLLGY